MKFKDRFGFEEKEEEIDQKDLPYKKKPFLLNIPERQFFEELQKMLPEKYIAYPQIVLGSIVDVKSGVRSFKKYHSKINKKTIDFVVFDKKYLQPVLGIEYDGKTHERSDRIERDNFVDDVFQTVGLPILHIKHEREVDFNRVKESIFQILK